ncbi:MFS transporter [Geomonas sp. RF6]|uniref:MFS transporter n=1 Tax=Geomonas sp. RF6 TaxID=2897342 RepID=UPI001E62F00E|nr:MFS transporter [Geomonas sp. RF6]UFS69029.1 MFS transporter [Geomonas sp. RF6]
MRNKEFRIFWTGQTISWLGGGTQSVAQGWLVWTLTRSPAQLALTAIMVSLPALLFSLLGGVTADRLSKRTLLIATQTASTIPALLLGLLTMYGRISASGILVLAFVQGMLNAFDIPARQAYLAELVPRDRLCRAVALNSVSFNATRMLGPAIAGCTIAAFGTAPCFFINGASFLIGVGTLLLLPPSPQSWRPELSRVGLPLRDLRDGLFFVLKEREIRRALLLVVLVSLLCIPFVPLLPVFAEGLRVGAQGLGIMSACAGSGSLVAALALAARKERNGMRGGAAVAGMVFAAALFLFAGSRDYRLCLGTLVVAGAGVVVFLAHINAFVQQAAPSSLRGRVMGAYTFALLGMAPVGSALMGWLASRLGASGALSLTSTICLAALMLFSFPSAPLPEEPSPEVPVTTRL